MTNRPFQRPGSSREPQPESWPYRAPSPEPVTVTDTPAATDNEPTDAKASSTSTPTKRSFGVRLVAATGAAGMLAGGIIVGGLATMYYAEPEPLTITADVFPEYVLGLYREDLAARSAGDTEALRQFDTHFEDQLQRFQFVHGGPGAAVGYGQSLTLTIVAGYQSLPLPSELGGEPGSGPPTLVSLESEDVSCVFQPSVGLYDSAVLDRPPDLTAKGRTDCVLNDVGRNLSLRITSRVPGDAMQTSTDFAQALESAHTRLVP